MIYNDLETIQRDILSENEPSLLIPAQGTAENAVRILVVDDEEGLRDILSDIISMLGYQVTLSSSGEDALSQCLTTPFDLVLTDLQMPGMDGLTLARHIKNGAPSTIVILMTALGLNELMEKIEESRIDSFILKPFGFDDIKETFRKMLELRETGKGTSFSVVEKS